VPFLTPLIDCLRYVSERHWTVVGHKFELLVSNSETVTIAVLARDERGHFLAVSPIHLDGQLGMGVIDLTTADAYFAQVLGSKANLNN
jgi:hypothetical protein